MKLKNIMTLSFIKHLKSSNLLDMNQKLHNCVPTNSFLSTITTNEDKTEEMFRAHWLNVKLESKEQSWDFQSLIGFDKNQLVCLHRWKVWWMIPRLLHDDRQEGVTPPETNFLLGKMDDQYLLILPIIDHNMVFTLEGSVSIAENRTNNESEENILSSDLPSPHLVINGVDHSPGPLYNENTNITRRAILIATDEDPFELIRKSMNIVKNHIRQQNNINNNEYINPKSCSRKNKISELSRSSYIYERGPGPSFIDHFGWCTWDSYYTDLSQDRVLSGLSSFIETKITPRFIILDDGWQGTDVDDQPNGKQWGGRLRSFRANFKFHPEYRVTEAHAKIHQEDIEGNSEVEINVEVESVANTIPFNYQDTHSLSNLIQQTKERYGIKYFMVWHSLLGYWAGVQPSSEDSSLNDNAVSDEMSMFQSKITFPYLPSSMYRMSRADALASEPFSTRGVGLPDHRLADQFYDSYHSTLREMNVDGVKVDAQSIISSLTDDRGGGWELALNFHIGLQKAIKNHFSNSVRDDGLISNEIQYPVIHCMCHSQATILAVAALYRNIGEYMDMDHCYQHGEESDDNNISLESMRITGLQQPVVRGSDDFWPLDPASHGPHIYTNTMNSLLLNHVGLQDWDAFQSRLNVPAAATMHAVSRAISGGPVYTSDRPKEHNAEILQRLAFIDGSLPRCLRGAGPVERLLFMDPQRTAGVPLLVQNINPAGGLVIAAFSIAGAVLEEDLNLFRFLHASEMKWPSQESVHTGLLDSSDEINTLKISYKRRKLNNPIPIYEDSAYSSKLEIHHFVSPQDVSEVKWLIRRYNRNKFKDQSLTTEYVARKYSDGSLYYVNSLSCKVPIHLQRVFDFEIVSFSPIIRFPLYSEWVAILGHTKLYNGGGAVLKAEVTSVNNDPTKLQLFAHLLGTGEYLIISSLQNIKVMSHKTLYGSESLDSDQNRSIILNSIITSQVSLIRTTDEKFEEAGLMKSYEHRLTITTPSVNSMVYKDGDLGAIIVMEFCK